MTVSRTDEHVVLLKTLNSHESWSRNAQVPDTLPKQNLMANETNIESEPPQIHPHAPRLLNT